MNYFNNITDLNGLKNKFRVLCKQLHPDTSGYNSNADFLAMHKQFKDLSNRLKFNTGFQADESFNADKFYDLIRKFDGLHDIDINFIGSFVWLTDAEGCKGAMYQQKETIKAINIDGLNSARWAKKKLSWYFSPKNYSQKYSKGKSIEQLKATYQSHTHKTKQSARLSA